MQVNLNNSNYKKPNFGMAVHVPKSLKKAFEVTGRSRLLEEAMPKLEQASKGVNMHLSLFNGITNFLDYPAYKEFIIEINPLNKKGKTGFFTRLIYELPGVDKFGTASTYLAKIRRAADIEKLADNAIANYKKNISRGTLL